MRLTVRTGLISTVLILAAMLGLQSWLAISQTGVVFGNAADLATNRLPSIVAALTLNNSIGDLRNQEAQHIAAETADDIAQADKDVAAQLKLIEDQRRVYEPLQSEPEEKAAYMAFSQKWTKYLSAQQGMLAHSRKNENDAAMAMFRGETKAIYDDFGKDLDTLSNVNVKAGAKSWASAQATYSSIVWFMAVMVTIAAIVVITALVFVIAVVTRPITKVTEAMRSVSGGALDTEVPFAKRRNEIGDMARALETFRLGLKESEHLRELASTAEVQSAQRMKQARNDIADQFQSKMGMLADAFAKSSSEVSSSARNLAATAEETSRQAQAVSGAAEEASVNVQTVAASTEELSASIREIASQVARSSDVANTAANEAARTEADVRALSDAASKIGEVVGLINSIAGQTNLLALNATIEAARAGEAGRGFAVVASEVKQLAAQTARATEEIGAKIAEIQSATNRAVGSMDKIVGTVSQIQAISTAIASAIEEQGAATGEISSNTQLAARSTEDVTGNITGVGRAAEMTGAASTQLMGLSGHLNERAGELQNEVVTFVKQLRAG